MQDFHEMNWKKVGLSVVILAERLGRRLLFRPGMGVSYCCRMQREWFALLINELTLMTCTKKDDSLWIGMCECCSLVLLFPYVCASCGFAWGKKNRIGLLFGVLELLAAFLSSTGWTEALRISGKMDWLQVGSRTASVAAEIFGCIVANVVGLFREEEWVERLCR